MKCGNFTSHPDSCETVMHLRTARTERSVLDDASGSSIGFRWKYLCCSYFLWTSDVTSAPDADDDDDDDLHSNAIF